eukprot:3653649-Prymnesium_polylepis.1
MSTHRTNHFASADSCSRSSSALSTPSNPPSASAGSAAMSREPVARLSSRLAPTDNWARSALHASRSSLQPFIESGSGSERSPAHR